MEVKKHEIIKVKDISDLLVCNRYWQDSDGELWLDFDDPNENFRGIFNAYRERKGFMQPTELKILRRNFNLSLREFAEWLGISYSKVSQVENNKRIQTLTQEVAFRKVQQDYHHQELWLLKYRRSREAKASTSEFILLESTVNWKLITTIYRTAFINS